ncbi:MAG: PAS domain-containing protein, partial [Nocardioides marinisabuli]|uniref:PAS domain-containing protein n=1 Tax=Nocardioides marinisabuli TaxID=419476 RepID=UPI00321C3983
MADSPDLPPTVWRSLVEASTDALWLLGTDGTTVWANARLGELLGRDDDLTGMAAPEAFAPEARERGRRHHAQLAPARRGRGDGARERQRAAGGPG